MGSGLREALNLPPSWTLPDTSRSLADCNLDLFTVINPNHENNSSQWDLRVLLVHYQNWGFLGDPQTRNVCQKWGWSSALFPNFAPALCELRQCHHFQRAPSFPSVKMLALPLTGVRHLAKCLSQSRCSADTETELESKFYTNKIHVPIKSHRFWLIY